MNLPTPKRLRAVQAKLIAKDARIRELESNLEAAQDHAHKLARGRGDVDHVVYLERQVKQLTESVSQLRKGVVDDVQTAELRRQLGVERRASRALEQRLAELQAANSGIRLIREVTA